MERVLADFRSRHIPVAVINEHLQGDLIEIFMAFRERISFIGFYPSPCSHSKFGLEKSMALAKGIPFNEEELKKYSDMAAEV